MKIGGKGRKILIVNLTRMGDLLQMTPLLTGLRRENSDVEITLLVLKEFREVCSGFPFVNGVEVFDGKDLMSRLWDSDGSLVESYRVVERVLERLRRKRFDTIINLSFSKYSGLLTSLLKIRDVRGITIDEYGNRLIKHPWVNHFFNMANNRDINLFNYVDFIRKIGGTSIKSAMSFAISDHARAFARAFYSDHGVSETDFVVGLQPGASSESKRWPAESFGTLAMRLIQEAAKVTVFGGTGEKDLGERIRGAVSLSPGHVERHLFDVIGKTSVEQLAALLARCNLLVTNDTGTMHVATAVGTRVIELSLGPVYFSETGPYGEGHLVIQIEMPCAPCGFHVDCKNPKCRDAISVTHAIKAIQMAREGLVQKGGQLSDAPVWNGIQLYRGDFDEDGMLEFLPLIRRSLRRMDLIKMVHREMWKIVLDERGGEIDPLRVCRKIHSLFGVNGIPENLEKDQRAFEVTGALARKGMEISRHLVQWSENIEQNISAIKTAGSVIHEIDEQIELQGMTHQACHPLTFMFRQGKENLEEGDLGILSQKTFHLYKTLLREATLMNRGLERTAACLKQTA